MIPTKRCNLDPLDENIQEELLLGSPWPPVRTRSQDLKVPSYSITRHLFSLLFLTVVLDVYSDRLIPYFVCAAYSGTEESCNPEDIQIQYQATIAQSIFPQTIKKTLRLPFTLIPVRTNGPIILNTRYYWYYVFGTPQSIMRFRKISGSLLEAKRRCQKKCVACVYDFHHACSVKKN